MYRISGIIKGEQGFALVITMLFAVVALALTGGLLFMTVQGTKVSGVEQRYATTLEASRGASDIAQDFLSNGKSTPDYGTVSSSTCLSRKMLSETFDDTSTYLWGTDCSAAGCSTQALNTSPDASVCPDIVSAMGLYTVYTKIVNTRTGADSTDASANKYRFYSVEIVSRKTNNPAETAKISFLFSVPY
ncbi:MAG: hypothetical protein HQL01_11315 [Nitrospirae bacterium]|nr:hypothetical protein [Nitrospirota bacterium]